MARSDNYRDSFNVLGQKIAIRIRYVRKVAEDMS